MIFMQKYNFEYFHRLAVADLVIVVVGVEVDEIFLRRFTDKAGPSSSIGIPYFIIFALNISSKSSWALVIRASSYRKSQILSFFCARSFSILVLIAEGSTFDIFSTSPSRDSRCSVSFSRKESFRSKSALRRPEMAWESCKVLWVLWHFISRRLTRLLLNIENRILKLLPQLISLFGDFVAEENFRVEFHFQVFVLLSHGFIAFL